MTISPKATAVPLNNKWEKIHKEREKITEKEFAQRKQKRLEGWRKEAGLPIRDRGNRRGTISRKVLSDGLLSVHIQRSFSIRGM